MGSAKILVVDDDRNLLEALSMRLAAAEHEVAAVLDENGTPSFGVLQGNPSRRVPAVRQTP